MTIPNKSTTDKFIEEEVERIEEDFYNTYRTRWSIKNMVRRGIIRILKRLNKYNG